MSDSSNAPEMSDDIRTALKMDLEMLEVDDVFSEDKFVGSDERITYVEFNDGTESVTLSEDEMRELPDAFFDAYVAWQQAGSECAEEARSERRQLYGGAY